MSLQKQNSARRRVVMTFLVVLTMETMAALVTLLVAVVTLFRCRRLYAEVLARAFARLLLWICDVRLFVHRQQPWPTKQTVYISNHTSTLDVFVIMALGLPNTRYFLSGFLRAIVPLGVLGNLVGTFWTVPQYRPQDRVRLFQRADRILKQTGESVYLSPEGMRVQTGEIGHFNKGAFHLATSLKAQMLPLYLAVPLPDPEIHERADPLSPMTVVANLRSYLGDMRPCDVHVHVDSPIDASGWRLEDLERNRQMVRERFLVLHEKWKAV